jgi:hypothetical protein
LNSLARKGKGQGVQTIVLTAFTNAAINNLAARILELHNEITVRPGSKEVVGGLNIYRLGSASTPKLKSISIVDPKDLPIVDPKDLPIVGPKDLPIVGPKDLPIVDPKDLRKKTAADDSNNDVVRVICGTVWKIRQASNPTTGVDYMKNIQMLMIDEGSQLLSADAIHAIECLDPKKGRLIVAGDHLQLGPVISGDYPASDNAIDPTGSIMRNLMRKRDNTPVSLQWVKGGLVDIGPCTWQLQDNFRMVTKYIYESLLDFRAVFVLSSPFTNVSLLISLSTRICNLARSCRQSMVPVIRSGIPTRRCLTVEPS